MSVIWVYGICVIIGWLVCEYKVKDRRIRIAMGVFSLTLAVLLTFTATSQIPFYERELHRSCMNRIQEKLVNRELSRVLMAVKKYNTTAHQTSSTYKAAVEMWAVLEE